MIVIPIKNNKNEEYNVYIDGESFEKINKYTWYIQKIGKNYYVASRTSGKFVYMHRLIMGYPENKCIDHINGNGLDNRIENMRICTHAENQRNQRIQKPKSSKYKGVYFNKQYKKYMSKIMINNKTINLGIFDNELDAAKAYNEAALKYHGEFACLNEVENV